MYDTLKYVLQKVQGRVFELSLEKGFASEQFIDLFMRSRAAADLDMEYNRLQWLGERYILEEFIEEAGDKLVQGVQYSKSSMFWIGYIYRFWHFHTDESSKKISQQAPARIMNRVYPAYHTFYHMELAIEYLKEDAEARNKRVNKKKKRYESGVVDLSPITAKTARKP